MKVTKTIDEVNGIYELECSRKEAEILLNQVKETYPYAVIEGTGYDSPIFILNVYANWGNEVENVIAEDGEYTTCINCGRCGDVKKPSRNSSLGIGDSQERCFYEEFWSEVSIDLNRHFIMNNHAYSFTDGEGGFYGRRFNIELEDGRVLEDIGLWHRGEVPECIRHLFVKGDYK